MWNLPLTILALNSAFVYYSCETWSVVTMWIFGRDITDYCSISFGWRSTQQNHLFLRNLVSSETKEWLTEFSTVVWSSFSVCLGSVVIIYEQGKRELKVRRLPSRMFWRRFRVVSSQVNLSEDQRKRLGYINDCLHVMRLPRESQVMLRQNWTFIGFGQATLQVVLPLISGWYTHTSYLPLRV